MPKRRLRYFRIAFVVAFGALATSCFGTHPATDADLISSTLRIDIDGCRTGKVRATGVALPGGWIATVAHSFDGVVDYSVVGRDAELVYLDLEKDVALLFGERPEGSPVVELARDPAVKTARVVSFPTPDEPPVVSGVEVIRLANVTLDGEGRRNALEIVADINPGDSGSPLVDDEGRLIGIVFASARGVESGWAVSVSEIIAALDVSEHDPITPPACP
jgi:S1-C subfamily serine protease